MLTERRYATVLERGWPGASWSLRGEDIENGLTWGGPGDRPSVAEITAIAETLWLAEAKDTARETIDRMAEREREAYITPGSGQAMVYLEKQAEARAFAEDLDPQSGDYPLLEAMIDIDAHPVTGRPVSSLSEAAAVVTILSVAWKAAAVDIEKRRIRAKRAVEVANTVDEVEAAMIDQGWMVP